MSHVDFDVEEVKVEVESPESVDVSVESSDVVVIVAQNVGPQGPQGDIGDTGPMDPGLPDHIISDLPHPVYDDGPSLALLYENAKV